MKKAISVITLLILVMCTGAQVSADSDAPRKIRTTCYLPTGNRCANGDYPTEGLTVAGRKEDIGKTAILYEVEEDGTLGPVIGYFEIEDTGGHYIKNGLRVDVYRETEQAAKEWVRKYGDYTYIQIIESEG